jgi:hypothetical protein
LLLNIAEIAACDANSVIGPKPRGSVRVQVDIDPQSFL